VMAEMGRFVEESMNAGILLATEGCMPSEKGSRVRRSGNKFSVTDGPFTEAKELVGGFAILRAESKKEAAEFTQRFMEIAGDGETEVRQINDGPDCMPNMIEKLVEHLQV
jgi:hypothetical protein